MEIVDSLALFERSSYEQKNNGNNNSSTSIDSFFSVARLHSIFLSLPFFVERKKVVPSHSICPCRAASAASVSNFNFVVCSLHSVRKIKSIFYSVFLHLLQFIFNDCECHFHMQLNVLRQILSGITSHTSQ